LSNAADDAKKKKQTDGAVTGEIKKIDAATNTLTVSLKAKKATTDREFKIADTTKFVTVNGKNQTDLAGGLKNEQLKPGATGSVKTDGDGKVTERRLGTAKKKKKENK